MKTKLWICLLFPVILFAQLPTASEIASKMTIGWNLGNALEITWGSPQIINQALIDSVSNAGFNTVRIPCAWNFHADQSTLEIDSTYLTRVREVVDYCYANEMYVMINCHWDGGWLENNVTTAKQESVNEKQNAYWTQIANYFKDYDEHLLFAGTNEPNVDNATQMTVLMSYLQTFLDAVRATGGNNNSRVLIVQGPSTDIDKTYKLMSSLPVDQIEDRLMVEIHYYTPWNFCGLEKDESWGKMFYFWGKDYHSTTNPSRNANWGEEDAVESYFQKMKTKFVDQGIPVILGEYSVIKRTSLTGEDLDLHIASREYFYKYVTNSMIRHKLIPVYWDNGWNGNNGLALFNRYTGAVTDQGGLYALFEGADTTTVGVKNINDNASSKSFSLMQNFPNPFNPSTVIRYQVADVSPVRLSIYNALGNKIKTLVDELKQAGEYSVVWHADDPATGIYFVRLCSDHMVQTRKMLLVK